MATIIGTGRGNLILRGTAGRDTIYGSVGNDKLYGGGDTDDLYGGIGADELYGEDGNDDLYGGWANDKLYGGACNAFVTESTGRDFVFEPGLDEADQPRVAGDWATAAEPLSAGHGGTDGHDSWNDARRPLVWHVGRGRHRW